MATAKEELQEMLDVILVAECGTIWKDLIQCREMWVINCGKEKAKLLVETGEGRDSRSGWG